MSGRTDRARGVLLGLACGDALGRPVEFRSAAQIATAHGKLSKMVGDGTWGQPAGAVAGARFGAAAIPERWLAVLDRPAELEALADALLAQATAG